jgi:hypothetical protein
MRLQALANSAAGKEIGIRIQAVRVEIERSAEELRTARADRVQPA